MEKTAFLQNLANQLQRPLNTTTKPSNTWAFKPVEKKYSAMNETQLLEALERQCANIHTDVVKTTSAQLADTLDEVVGQYGGGPVSIWDDPRFMNYGCNDLLEEKWPANDVTVYKWDRTASREHNFTNANRARVGIAFSEYCLTESGTVVLYSAEGAGKAVGLLPYAFVAIVPKSSILPRMTQAAEAIQKRVDAGELLPHAIDFVSGPSNSADIEMKLVVGVHGPVEATYIILEDC